MLDSMYSQIPYWYLCVCRCCCMETLLNHFRLLLLTLWSKCAWIQCHCYYTPFWLLFLVTTRISIDTEKKTTLNYKKLLEIALNLTNRFDSLQRLDFHWVDWNLSFFLKNFLSLSYNCQCEWTLCRIKMHDRLFTQNEVTAKKIYLFLLKEYLNRKRVFPITKTRRILNPRDHYLCIMLTFTFV